MNKLPDQQQAMLERLVRLPDGKIDLTDQPEVLDWSDAERGKFYRSVKRSQNKRRLF